MLNKKTILVLFMSAALVGCSSSNSNGSINTNNGTTGTISLPRDNGLKLTTNKSSGAVNSHATYEATSDINKLIVNGETIDLVPAGFVVSAGFTNFFNNATGVNGDNLPRIVSGNKYSNTRFGLIKNNLEIMAFSQGQVTDVANVPTAGTATYIGDYAGYDHTNDVVGTGEFTGTADFGAKTFTVFAKADNNGFPGINITGVISGNTFTGKIGDTVETKGQFYGNNAEEVGGTYSNHGFDNYYYTAAFGAKKQ